MAFWAAAAPPNLALPAAFRAAVVFVASLGVEAVVVAFDDGARVVAIAAYKRVGGPGIDWVRGYEWETSEDHNRESEDGSNMHRQQR